MPTQLPVGPYRMIEVEPGQSAPWYMIPFDADGNCTGPLTRDHLVKTLRSEEFSDVFLFSHGWNNDWADATRSYEHFLNGYSKMRRTHNLAYPRPFKPLLVGVFWPSIALVLPWEQGPVIAAAPMDDPELADSAVAQEQRELESLAAALPQRDRERFYVLAQQKQLSEAQALELARILAPLYKSRTRLRDDIPAMDAPVTPEQLVAQWRKIPSQAPASRPSGEGGFAAEPGRPSGEGGFAREPGAPPQAAGGLDFLDPRQIVRVATVLQMKDRAGRVGARGVGPLLIDLLAARATARLHLIGHSYGCRVLLSAICYKPLPRKVNSLLLLQPAVSHLCFAADATGNRQPGGYHSVLKRVEQPILQTFSSKDIPLHKLFHFAARRASDIGDQQIAGVSPSPYAALGGYGPEGCTDCMGIMMKPRGEKYALGTDTPKLFALNAAEHISGHGDISNDSTWWALYQQVAR